MHNLVLGSPSLGTTMDNSMWGNGPVPVVGLEKKNSFWGWEQAIHVYWDLIRLPVMLGLSLYHDGMDDHKPCCIYILYIIMCIYIYIHAQWFGTFVRFFPWFSVWNRVTCWLRVEQKSRNLDPSTNHKHGLVENSPLIPLIDDVHSFKPSFI